MQNLRISTSLYDEDVKASVHMICHLLGAKYTDRLGRKNTHLIVSRAEGAKFRAASEWGLHTVTIEWRTRVFQPGRRSTSRHSRPSFTRGGGRRSRSAVSASRGERTDHADGRAPRAMQKLPRMTTNAVVSP